MQFEEKWLPRPQLQVDVLREEVDVSREEKTQISHCCLCLLPDGVNIEVVQIWSWVSLLMCLNRKTLLVVRCYSQKGSWLCWAKTGLSNCHMWALYMAEWQRRWQESTQVAVCFSQNVWLRSNMITVWNTSASLCLTLHTSPCMIHYYLG